VFKILNPFLDFHVLSEISNYSLECIRAHSMNKCNRVGLISYIPYLLGAWG
jgi:hypothetical protein